MPGIVAAACASAVFLCAGVRSPAAEVDFVRDIKPLFAEHCAKCHGEQKQKGDLRLDTRSGALKGGGDGTVILPGKSAESPLWRAVSDPDPDKRMPREAPPLSAHQISLLRDWIDQGATGPEDAPPRKLPWSFRPVQAPDIPQSAGTQGAIDWLLERKLAEKNLTFSPEAERRVLLRRMFLVMLGIPPSPQEVDEFVRDTRPDACERLVDRVLASPHRGERWARHWLDLVRFAESNGFETNRVRKSAWPYRDYVIRAINDDKPYDQFVREQIAGDALGADAATGYLVAGAVDLVKSPDINLTLMQRQDELADMVNTTGTAFLGLTLGCARCHEHKFDPVSQKDFYAAQAVFAGVQFAERPMRSDMGDAARKELAALQADAAAKESTLAALREKARAQLAASGAKLLRSAVNERLNEETFPAVAAAAVRFTILASSGSEPCLDELEIYDTQGRNVALAADGAKASASGTLPGYPIHKLEHLNDGQTGNSRSWISNTAGTGWVRIDFPSVRQIQRIVWSRDRQQQFRDRVPTRYRIEATSDGGKWSAIASSDDRAPARGADATQELLKALPADEAAAAATLLSDLEKARARIAFLTNGMPAWLGTFSKPDAIHRLHRGDPLLKREPVAPDIPEIFGSLRLAMDAPEQTRRLEFARWLTSAQNPLTSRVMVNRIWQHMFGVGLVDTPSDFGGNGTQPSHPELLDWLAAEFVRSGWSVKHLQRLILLSRAFRQSSAPRADGLAADASARLLWRFPPRRMEAEAMRDCILNAAGALDLRMGGPGFFLQKVEEDNVYRYFPKEQVGPDEFRRMIYLTRIRQEQDPVFGSFDCPSGNQVVPRRPRSNTPLQALNLFNSPFMLQQAELFSQRLRQEAGIGADAQVRMAFRLLTAREPDAQEQEISTAFIREKGLAAFCRALLNSSEFLFVF